MHRGNPRPPSRFTAGEDHLCSASPQRGRQCFLPRAGSDIVGSHVAVRPRMLIGRQQHMAVDAVGLRRQLASAERATTPAGGQPVVARDERWGHELTAGDGYTYPTPQKTTASLRPLRNVKQLLAAAPDGRSS